MKLYERIENNNFDEIDINRAIELIEGGNGHLVYNENYFKLQKENENLKSENSRLKVIRYSREYGTENIYLITKSDLVQIDINKYMIEIEDGKFVDLKQIYQENKELEKENEKLNKLHIQDNKHLDFIMKHSVSIQKVKDKIEELDYKDIGNFERRCKQEVLQSLLEKEQIYE